MNVKDLIEELKKIPMEAPVTPYEGEDVGITVGGVAVEYGFIYTESDKETELIVTKTKDKSQKL